MLLLVQMSSKNMFVYMNTHVGCAALLCLVVCLTLLASFFLPSHLSLNMYNHMKEILKLYFDPRPFRPLRYLA